ncbi:helix-turn-helix domain-containing protein [Alphaproteobacteria bacterium HT1-32]|nr:helix-turn-helix domain-containing protein [Alphaproteobacteria bacterium HT1-32]
MNFIPTYALYGENRSDETEFFIHCETIASRSKKHQWRIKPHKHARFLQILHVSQGWCESWIEGRETHFGSGGIVVVPAGISHGYRFSADIDGHVLTIVADSAEQLFPEHQRIARWFNHHHFFETSFADNNLDDLNIALQRFAGEYEQRRIGRSLFLELQLRMILLQIYRMYHEANDDEVSPPTDVDGRLLSLNDLINRHYREHQSVAFYAAETGISPTHLNRLTRQAYGVPVSGLIARRVIQQAKRYLVFSAKPVQSVAFELGFSDPCYFSRYFTRHTGSSPLAFRRAQLSAMDG